MIEQANQVREFMRVFGQELPEKPTIPAEEVQQLRYRLIDEEKSELFESMDNIQSLDAICDLLYVVLGAGAAYGFSPEQIAKGFTEVHRSNMSKLWSSWELRECAGIDLSFKRVNGLDLYIVKNSEGKVIKSPSYSPAQLKKIVGE